MDEDIHCNLCEKVIDSPYHQYWSVETTEGVIVCEECYKPAPLDMNDMMDALEEVENEIEAEHVMQQYTEDPDKRCAFCGILASESWFGDWHNELYCTEECAEQDIVDL